MFNTDNYYKVQNKNKENSLSFRNIAANAQYSGPKLIKHNTVDKSFRSISDQSNYLCDSYYNLQQQINHAQTCFNHPSKIAEYLETVSQQHCCKLCAAKMASLGYKLIKSQSHVPRDQSPSPHQLRKRQPKLISHKQDVLQDVFQSRMRSNTHSHTNENIYDQNSKNMDPICKVMNINAQNQNSNHLHVKFSSFASQMSRNMQNLDTLYVQNQEIIEEYLKIYSEKMEKIEELLSDINIKDTLYINKLKFENQHIYQLQKNKRKSEKQKQGCDIFGKSLIKQSRQELIQFKLPSEHKIEKLDEILARIEQVANSNLKSQSNSTVALIKSVYSNESNKAQEARLKNSSSISNLSSKSYFKKEKKLTQNGCKFASQFDKTKMHQEQLQIQSSRLSSNSAIIRKNVHHSRKEINLQSGEIKRRKTEMSFEESNSCQDTPESIKSKISSNSFVLPRNAAIAMFQKIDVCESIDIRPGQDIREQQQSSEDEKFGQDYKINESVQKMVMAQKNGQRKNVQGDQIQSCYTNKSETRSIASQASKGRKSFNRYRNFDNQQ